MSSSPESLDLFPLRYCPVCANVVRGQFKPGPARRPDARCPHCKSLERQRFLAILISCLKPTLGVVDVMLDVAPSPQTTMVLDAVEARSTVRFDLGLDSRLVDVLGSLTQIPMADESVDFLFCYHVLEHIPDDRAAMAEIARVLRPGGAAVLQVPIRFGTMTDEDPSLPAADRAIRFGQHDHVRWYGDDFEDRLRESGLTFQRLRPIDVVGERGCAYLRLEPEESVWIAYRGDRESAVSLSTSALPILLDTLLEQLTDRHQKLKRTQARLVQARARVARLRQQPRPPARTETRRRIGTRLRRRKSA